MAQKRIAEQVKPSSFYAVFCVLIIGFLLVTVRLIFIQGMEQDQWRKRANLAQEKNLKIKGDRGIIYDRNGNILAMNLDRPSVYAIPSDIEAPAAISKKLSPILGLSQTKLLQRLTKKSNFVWLKRKISPEQMSRIETMNIKGIRAVLESQRIYPKGALFGHLIGFVGLDNQGLEGIELKQETILRGTEGAIILERDAYGNSVFPKDLQYIEASPGKDLHLTVDERIQYISERELDRVVKETGAKGGTVLVMDPWTGEILSMAVRPKFNPNKVRTSSPEEWRNRAITDFYEPGSTFKIITTAAALEENLVTADDLIDCEEGTYRVKGTIIHDHVPFGVIPFRQVIAHSSNIGTIKVAEVLGQERLASYVRAFGFGERLGIDLTGESPGLFRKTSRWSGRSLASIAIGQEIGVTPLQMITATSVIANGGYLMTPKIIREIRGKKGKDAHAPKIKRRVLTEKTAHEVTEILRMVVSDAGTARRAAVPGYAVAGKTGTAQKINPETRRYSRDKFVSSFVGFVPAEDPVVTILVMIDEPEGKGWGGEIAAPVFSTIAKEVLYYLKVPPRTQTPSKPLSDQGTVYAMKARNTPQQNEFVIKDSFDEIGPSR